MLYKKKVACLEKLVEHLRQRAQRGCHNQGTTDFHRYKGIDEFIIAVKETQFSGFQAANFLTQQKKHGKVCSSFQIIPKKSCRLEGKVFFRIYWFFVYLLWKH